MRKLLGVVGLVIGCGGPPDPEEFEADFASVWCEREEECALGDFERKYSSFDDCRFDKEDDVDIPRWNEGCEVDPDGADECLEYLHTTECAGWEDASIDDACESVYPC